MNIDSKDSKDNKEILIFKISLSKIYKYLEFFLV